MMGELAAPAAGQNRDDRHALIETYFAAKFFPR